MTLFGRQRDWLSGTYFLEASMFVAKSTPWAFRPSRKGLEIKPFSKVWPVCGSTRSPAELMKKPRNVIVVRSWLKNRYGWGLNNKIKIVRHTAHKTWEFKKAKKKVTVKLPPAFPMSSELKFLDLFSFKFHIIFCVKWGDLFCQRWSSKILERKKIPPHGTNCYCKASKECNKKLVGFIDHGDILKPNLGWSERQVFD